MLNLTPIVYTCLPICICQEADCHQPMEVIFQPSEFVDDVVYQPMPGIAGRTGYFQATCKNNACDFFGFTLSLDTYDAMPEETREEYRQQRRKQRAAEERRIAILSYAYTHAINNFYGCCTTAWTATLTPALDNSELKLLARMQYLVDLGHGAYFITPDGCELIGKEFAGLGKTLSHHVQWDLCVRLVDAGIDLAGIIDETQQARVDWSIAKKEVQRVQRAQRQR